MRKFVVVFAIALAGAACSDTSAPEDELVVEGDYNLLTINGQLLPVTLVEFPGLYRLQQVGGTLKLNANKTFVERDSLREIMGQEVNDTTIVLTGVWERADSAIVLTTTRDGSVLFGIARKNRLELNFESVVSDSIFRFVYTK